MKKHFFSILVTCLGLLLGYLASVQVNGFLGISYRDKSGLPELQPTVNLSDTSQDTNPDINPDVKTLRPLTLRLADLGGVGILPDTADWGDNYEHNVHRFEDLILAEAPYLDQEAYNRIDNELDVYLYRMQECHVSGIVFPAFLELVTFENWVEGDGIYSGNDDYRSRHRALQKGFGEWINKMAACGLEVYLYTDMVALTPPLEKYLTNRYGGLDGESVEFWEVYKSACEEIFTRLSGVSGIMLRIGEAGSIYNKPGWDYYSSLAVKTDKAVEKMLTAFLETAEKHDKKIIFRSWSVGIGEIGDMHTNPETYERVLGKIRSENLIVSTKYCRGDFYSWLPFNETLLQGSQRRIAEFQLRREFEGMNAFPNYMGPLYQRALQDFTRQNPAFDGVWMWTQEGGPLRAGPLNIYPFHGFNAVNGLNVHAMGRLLNRPDEDIGRITEDWVTQEFGPDTLLRKTVSSLMLNSHSTVRKGLYIGPFARYDVRALGLEPPPMLWIFEWDLVGGSPSVFANIYYVSKDHVDAAVNEGYEAAAEAARMKAGLDSVRDRVTVNQEEYDKLAASAGYEQNLLETLAHFRNYMLGFYRWLDKGGNGLRKSWETSSEQFIAKQKLHEAAYAGNLDFPAYNFREANAATLIAGRTGLMAWLARLLGLIFVLSLILGMPIVHNRLPFFKGKRAFATLWHGIVDPAGNSATTCEKADTAPLMFFLIAWLALALLVFTSFTAPVFVISLIILSILYVTLNLLFIAKPGECDKVAKGFSLLAPAFAFLGLLMLFTAWRGPMAFWYLFWTSSAFRIVFMMLFVLFVVRAYYTWAVTLHRTLAGGRIRTAGIILLCQGILFALAGGVVAIPGFEKVLTILNDELLLLPGGLSRILGITTHLGIPTGIPLMVCYIGLGLIATGFILFMMKRKSAINQSLVVSAAILVMLSLTCCSNHGFASHVVHVLYRDVLGIAGVDKTQKVITFRFQDTGLDECRGQIPVENGIAAFSWKKEKNRIVYTKKVPEGYTVKITNHSNFEIKESSE